MKPNSFLFTVLEIIAFSLFYSPTRGSKYEEPRKPFQSDYDICGTVDPELQCQNIDHTGERRFMFWKSICDERFVESVKEYIVEFLVYYQGPVPIGYTRNQTLELAKFWRCFVENEKYYHETTVDFVGNIGNKHSPFVLACHIPKEMGCPSTAWIRFGNITLTNKVNVERQLPSKKNPKKTKDDVTVTLCASPIVSKAGTMYDSPIRIAEWLAYNKFIGVNNIFIPIPDMENPNMHININPSILRLINSYKKSGLVDIFQFPLHLQGLYMVPQIDPLYQTINMLKGLLYTYCYLRHALVSTHFMVHDMDEIISFPMKKHKNIQNLISTIKAANLDPDLRSFVYRDVVFPDTNKCHPSDTAFEKDVEKAFPNNSALRSKIIKESALTRLSKHTEEPFHLGKSIIHSEDCFTIWFHFCWWRVSDHFIHRANKQMAVGIQMDQGPLTQWKYGLKKGQNYSAYHVGDLYKINNVHFRRLDEKKFNCSQMKKASKVTNMGVQIRGQIFDHLARAKRQFLN